MTGLTPKFKKILLAGSCCWHDDLILILEDLNTVPPFLSPLCHAETTSYILNESIRMSSLAAWSSFGSIIFPCMFLPVSLGKMDDNIPGDASRPWETRQARINLHGPWWLRYPVSYRHSTRLVHRYPYLQKQLNLKLCQDPNILVLSLPRPPIK